MERSAAQMKTALREESRRISGGPGRNRTTDTRIFKSCAGPPFLCESKGYAQARKYCARSVSKCEKILALEMCLEIYNTLIWRKKPSERRHPPCWRPLHFVRIIAQGLRFVCHPQRQRLWLALFHGERPRCCRFTRQSRNEPSDTITKLQGFQTSANFFAAASRTLRQ